jgi:hypothetical protein
VAQGRDAKEKVMPLTEKERAAERLAQRLVADLRALGVEVVSPSDDATLKIHVPEAAIKRVRQLFKDGAWEGMFCGMVVKQLGLADSRMHLMHSFDINWPSQPDHPPAEPQQQPTEGIAKASMETA